MVQINADASPKNICLEFFNFNTVDLEMKEIGRRRITSRYLSKSHLTLFFYFASEFIASAESYSYRSPTPIISLNQSVLIYNLLYGSGITKLICNKYISLTVTVTFGPLYYIGFASVPHPPFEIVLLFEADSTRSTSRV